MMIDILHARLCNHLLLDHTYQHPQDVVHHMLCIQAQDRNQHLRAIASRTGCTQDDIIQAYNEGKIIRTRTQRGTIHTVCAQDAGWMVKLCASKTLSTFTRRKEFLGINDYQYDHALQLVQEYLSSGPKLRKDIRSHLSQSGIDVTSGFLYNILCFAGSSGIIVRGPVIDGEHAFALTSQWIKQPKQLDGDDALREVCLCYFTSHGPATIEDLQRRSGLGKTQIKQGIYLCGDQLSCIEEEGKAYYYHSSQPSSETSSTPSDVHFLAGFDERLLGYKDRSATVHYDHLNRIDVSRNGIFKPTVMINGETIGIRTIKHKPKVSEVTVTPFTTFTPEQQLALQSEVIHYQTYLAKPVTVYIN